MQTTNDTGIKCIWQLHLWAGGRQERKQNTLISIQLCCQWVMHWKSVSRNCCAWQTLCTCRWEFWQQRDFNILQLYRERGILHKSLELRMGTYSLRLKMSRKTITWDYINSSYPSIDLTVASTPLQYFLDVWEGCQQFYNLLKTLDIKLIFSINSINASCFVHPDLSLVWNWLSHWRIDRYKTANWGEYKWGILCFYFRPDINTSCSTWRRALSQPFCFSNLSPACTTSALLSDALSVTMYGDPA